MTARFRALALVFLCLWPVAARAAAKPDAAALRAEAYEAAQWAQMTAAGAALAQVGARFAAGTDALAQAVRERQDLAELWRAKDKALVDALGAADAPARANATTLRKELETLTAKLDALDKALAQRFPAYADLASPKPLSIAETRKLLRPEEALIEILTDESATFVFVVTKEGDDWSRSELGAAKLGEAVKHLRLALDPHGEPAAPQARAAPGPDRNAETPDDGAPAARGTLAFDRAAALKLYEALLKPLEPGFKGKKRLLIVADGALSALPFSVLVTEPPAGSDDDAQASRDTAWLAKSYALTTLPAVSSLRALRLFQKRAQASEPFRGFGAPSLKGALGADAGTVASLQPLPETEGELRALALALDAPASTILTGDRATVTAIRSADLSKTRVIAFATHGLMRGDLAGLGEPALVFTPPATPTAGDTGLLGASDAALLNLSADWVVLSACNTAASDGSVDGDGLSGLARAFFYAGASTLLVSHWPVNDQAAARLTTGAFAALKSAPDIGRAEAFRRSMLALMGDASNPLFAHPRAWAPFVVVGEGF